MSQFSSFTAGGGGVGTVITLTGDAGGAINPDGAGNITVAGGTNITTTGAGNTITFDLVATIPVTLGGTGLTTITDHAVMLGSGVGPVTALAPAATGNVLTAVTGADPAWAQVDMASMVTGILPVPNGGTGLATITDHGVILGSGAGNVSVTAVGATGTVLKGNTGADPTYGAVDLATDVTGVLTVPNGGTGLNTITDHGIMLGSGVGAVTPLGVGTTNNVLTAVTGADPAWAQVDLASMVTGILPVPNGGTGLATITDHGVMVGSGVGNVTPLAVGTNGMALLGSTGADPVFATLGSTLSTVQYTTGAGTLALDCQVAQALTGFASWDGAGPYFDDTVLGDFEVSESGVGYIRGERVTWTAPQTETGMTAGNTYLIYIDDTGTIGKTTTFSTALFRDNIVLFECMRDSTAGTNLQVTVKENHPYTVPYETSVYLHDAIGTSLTAHENGANIILDGTQKIAISGADELEDHGLETDIPDSGGTGVTWHQYFTLGSGKWAQNSSTDTFVGEYNNAGTVAALGGNKYGVYKLYVSKDNITVTTPTYFAILHTAQFNNLAAAQTAVADGTIATISNELAALEMARLGYIIFAESSTSIVDVIIDKETIGTGGTFGGTNIASLVLTDVTNFNVILNNSDTTVQAALETLDDFGGPLTDHTVMLGSGLNTPLSATSVGTNGQVLVGSTGADPDFATIGSTDGSITVTGGAGTLVLEGTAASVTQVGSVELTTDAEAIAGTDTTRAVTSEALKAKLGTQTDHGVLVGSATTAAITALAVGTNGQVLVGSTGADPVFATITDGVGVTTTLGAGTLEIESTGTTIRNETGTTYTLALTDRGKMITFSNAAAIAVTIPTNASIALPVGTSIGFQQLGAGQITFSGAGTTLQSADTALTTVKQYSVGYMMKTATDTWIFGGDLEA